MTTFKLFFIRRSCLHPRREDLWFFGEKLQAVAKLALLAEERMEALLVNAVAVVAVAAGGDRLCPSHNAQPSQLKPAAESCSV